MTEATCAMVLRMLNKDIAIPEIAEITGLATERIEKLFKEKL